MTRLGFHAIFAFGLLFSPPAAQDAVAPVSARGYKLQLRERENRCVVAYAAGKRQGELQLELPPPCQFVHDEKGAVRSYFYKDVGKATALLVVGGPIDSQRKDKLMKDGCGTQAQVVLLTSRGVSTTKEIGHGGVFCPSGGVEEKMFSILAHSK